jgi:putative tricarboxylic transport membrane protein
MDSSILDNLALGFSIALSFQNIAFCFVGILIGTLVGVLPGIGPIATLAMLLPATFYLPPVAALIMLAGIYYGSQYGGSTTAILVNMPGESSSIVTCLDGHQMARAGRGGAALAVAALGSFFAGTFANGLIVLVGPPLAYIAIQFGSPEYFSLIVLGLTGSVLLAHGSLPKAIAMTILGLFLGLIGTDPNSGVLRMTLGVKDLYDGLSITALAIGLFGVTEILTTLEKPSSSRNIAVIGSLMPTRAEFRRAIPAVLRGSAVGSLLGLLPGGGALLAAFVAYALEKRVSKNPEKFGHGAIEGVAGPESANNAGAQTSFIPMLTLGLPANPVMALMIGALVLQGITPGPRIIVNQPELFWGLIASMWIGNLMLVILNLPLIGLWVSLFKVPYRLLFPSILLICCVGVQSVGNSTFDVWTLGLLGFLGYIFVKLHCEPAPLILGFILGPLLEENLRRALMLSDGDPTIFVRQPISAGLLVAAATLLVFIILPSLRQVREEAFKEG